MGGTASNTDSSIGVRLFIMMFLEFFIWGAWFVTVGNYMGAHGMKEQIGWAYTVVPIAAIVSPLFLGLVADRYFATERVLAALHLVGGAILLAVPFLAQSGSTVLILVLLAYALCYMPTLGLTNTLAFHNMTDQEKQFPLIRVGGTVGWIVANIVVSKFLHADTLAIQFYVAGAASLALGVYSFTLPHTPPPAAGKQANIGEILGLDALKLLAKPAFAVFILCSFLICIPLAGYYSWAAVFVKEAGKLDDPAFYMSFGQMSEFFFMIMMPLFFARLGVKWMLLAGMAAWVARYGLFTVAADNHALGLIIASIVLHGICYDFFFVTGQIYVDKRAPKEIRGQVQGFLVLITQGLGMVIGQIAMQKIVDANTVEKVTNWHSVWLLPCLFAAAIMVVFFLLFRDDSREAPEAVNAAGMGAQLELGPVE